jgi:signal recognition particle receptor subunit beta
VVLFNYTTMQITAKIVYYGPGLCGKTTNLQFVHKKTAPRSRGEMISLETEADRTLFFDLLPLEVGVIQGMRVRLQLYTVPGQVFYNATRKLVLKGVDAVVFVADSQTVARDANIESLANLETNLAEMGLTLDEIPIVFQFNKRDIQNIETVEALNGALNPGGAPYFEAAALHGIGVFETLKAISRSALGAIRRKLADNAAERKPPSISAAAPQPSPVPEPETVPPPRPDAAPKPAQPPAGLDFEARPPEDVVFAEEGTDKHVRAVPIRDAVDIQEELEQLRTIVAPTRTAAADSGEIERRLEELMRAGGGSRQELKRKASVEVPARLLKASTTVRIHLAFDDPDGEQVVKDAVTVKLAGNRKRERLLLHLDLDLKGTR